MYINKLDTQNILIEKQHITKHRVDEELGEV